MAHIELASSNPGKLLQAEKAAAGVIDLTNRRDMAYEYYFDEEAIKAALETQLHITPNQPFMYALTNSQLKMMKHADELAVREPDHAREVIPLVTDSIAVTLDEDGHYLGINRDELKADAALKERYAALIKKYGVISYAAFASFTFPGDDTIYTTSTFLDVKPKRPITAADLPTNPNTIPDLAESYSAGYLGLREADPAADFEVKKLPMTCTDNWDNPHANRYEPARQYMGGTAYGVMNLVKAMADMSPEKRMEFDGRLDETVSVPFVRINKKAYAATVASLPPPPSKSA